MTSVQQRNAEMVDILKTDFVHRIDTSYAWSRAVGLLSTLPCLRALYVGNAHKLTKATNKNEVIDNILDINMTSPDGNYPMFGYQSYIPFMTFAAANTEYLAAVDNENHHILGTETDYVLRPGLTFGCWLKPATVETGETGHKIPFGRWDSVGSNGAYALLHDHSTTNEFGFATRDSSNVVNVLHNPGSVEADKWYFLAAIWEPDELMMVIVNNIATEFSGTPASVLSDADQGLSIGADGSGTVSSMFNGDICLAFLCASALYPPIIASIFQHTAPMFGFSLGDVYVG